MSKQEIPGFETSRKFFRECCWLEEVRKHVFLFQPWNSKIYSASLSVWSRKICTRWKLKLVKREIFCQFLDDFRNEFLIIFKHFLLFNYRINLIVRLTGISINTENNIEHSMLKTENPVASMNSLKLEKWKGVVNWLK